MPKSLIPQIIHRFAGGLRFPWLFALTAALFAVDLMVPDFVPLADEILLGLGTLVLGALKKRASERQETDGEVVEVEVSASDG